MKNVTPDESFRASVKGVIPAAGLGTRMRPLSMFVPKELLPVQCKPMIQWALEEAIIAGLQEVAIVVREGKESISDLFAAMRTSAESSWQYLRRQLSEIRLQFVYQRKPLGLGDALYESREFIGDSPFVMIIPDQLFFAGRPATTQLLTAAAKDPKFVWSSIVQIPEPELKFFPGARTFKLVHRSDTVWTVLDLNNNNLEPNSSCRIGFGRTFFPTGAVDYFSPDYLNPKSGEVDLLLSFKALIRDYSNCAIQLEGRAMDFGTWPAYAYFNTKVYDLLSGVSSLVVNSG